MGGSLTDVEKFIVEGIVRYLFRGRQRIGRFAEGKDILRGFEILRRHHHLLAVHETREQHQKADREDDRRDHHFKQGESALHFSSGSPMVTLPVLETVIVSPSDFPSSPAMRSTTRCAWQLPFVSNIT